MVNTKISELTALTAPATGDLIPAVDISDTTQAASGTTKKVTYNDFFALYAERGLVNYIYPVEYP